MPKVSVLVAVYNAKQWLPQSLGSLLSQTLQDIQVICVDDCSTDGSLTILNDYASRDQRFEVIHLEENQGQARARGAFERQPCRDSQMAPPAVAFKDAREQARAA